MNLTNPHGTSVHDDGGSGTNQLCGIDSKYEPDAENRDQLNRSFSPMLVGL